MDSFNPYGRQQDPNYGPRSAGAAQQVHVGGGRYRQSSASTHLHSARPAAGFYSPGAGAPTPTTGGYTANSRPAYTPAGNSTATAAGTPITIPLAQPYPGSYSYTPMVMGSSAGYQGHFDNLQARSDPFASSESLRAAQILGQNLQPNSAPMSSFNGSAGIGPLNLGARFGAATVLSPYQNRMQAEAAARAAPG